MSVSCAGACGRPMHVFRGLLDRCLGQWFLTVFASRPTSYVGHQVTPLLHKVVYRMGVSEVIHINFA